MIAINVDPPPERCRVRRYVSSVMATKQLSRQMQTILL